MAVNSREKLVCWGFKKQDDIATINAAGSYWSMRMLAFGGVSNKLNTENDAQEYGKGHEYASQAYQTSWDSGGTIEKTLSAEIGAWAACFGLGKVVKTGSSHLTYTCTPLNPSDGDSDELPFFTFVEQIRPGANVVLDRAAIGCAVEGFSITATTGPSRQNVKIAVEVVGSGKLTAPSGVTMPTQTAEKQLLSAGMAVTIIGVDYVTLKNIVSLEMGWKNNLRTEDGFYPGSGYQTPGDATTGAIRGRLEVGDRAGSLKFLARIDKDSEELTKLQAQTSGTAVVSFTHDTNNSLEFTWQKVTFGIAEIVDTDGKVTVSVECVPMWHDTNGILTVVAKCDVDNICQAEA